MTHATVEPVYQRSYSEELTVDVRRIVGYRCVFPDGTKGPVRRSMKDARRDRPNTREEATGGG